MSTAARLRLTLNIAGVLATLLAVLAASARAQDQKAPVIRKTTTLVQLNVVVLDNHRRPVNDLSQDDFEVFDNGREQKLVHFSVSSIPTAGARSAASPLVITNRPEQSGQTPGTVTIILVDELIDREIGATDDHAALRSARLQVLKFLATLQPGQQVALYALRQEGVVVIQDLTDDSAALAVAAKTVGAGLLKTKMLGGAGDAATARTMKAWLEGRRRNQSDKAQDLRRVLVGDAFQAIAHHLEGTPARKNVVWISSNFPSLVTGLDPQLMLGERDTALSTQPQFANPEGHYDQLRDFARRLSSANISVYPVDAKGLANGAGVAASALLVTGPLIAGASRRITDPPGGFVNMVNDQPAYVPPPPGSVSGLFGERQAMDLLASETGGRAFYDANALDEDLREIVVGAQVSYLLEYYPGNSAWDGKFHHVEVKLRRRGLSLLCRKGYFALDKPLPQDSDTPLHDVAKSMLDWSGIGVTLNVSSNPLEWFQQEVVVKLDTQEIHFENTGGRWRANLDVAFVQLAKDGRVLQGAKDHLGLALSPETYSDATTQGWFYPKTLDVDPKAEKLRVVVRDLATGAVGSVSVPVYHHKGS